MQQAHWIISQWAIIEVCLWQNIHLDANLLFVYISWQLQLEIKYNYKYN